MKNFAKMVIGLILFSAAQAAVPQRATPGVSEIQANKVATPDFEQDYLKLTSKENQYAESWDQQQRIRAATQRYAARNNPAPKKVAVRTLPTKNTKKKRK